MCGRYCLNLDPNQIKCNCVRRFKKVVKIEKLYNLGMFLFTNIADRGYSFKILYKNWQFLLKF
jgi:hypothetical protein